MEALACGTPVVAFRRGALSEIVEDGRTGFLVETVSQMARAISDASQLSSSICRERAEQNFSAERMIADYLSLYETLVHASATEQWEKVA
jgi:glycosyltransferase involved in cell wall biosynthesis